MVELNKVEDALLEDLEKDALSLLNGGNSDLSLISRTVGRTARVVAAMARNGGVTPAECTLVQSRIRASIRNEIREAMSRSDWKAKLAIILGIMVPLCGTLAAIVFKVYSQ